MPVPERRIRFEALTPIWTGDANGRSDSRTLETGILGSLRWWLEALARGRGAHVPDPTRDAPEYDPDKGPTGGLDPVSLLFGATGWRRRFRLEVTKDGQAVKLGNIRIETGTTRHDDGFSTWYFKSKARVGDFEVRVSGNDEDDLVLLGGLLGFISRWGAVGAKTQNGCGVIQYEATTSEQEALRAWLNRLRPGPNEDLPRIDRMFFAQLQDEKRPFERDDPFYLKYRVRELLHHPTSDPDEVEGPLRRSIDAALRDQTLWMEMRHDLMGYTVEHSDEREGAKIHMSMPYDGGLKMRVWGWIPERWDAQRDRVTALIEARLRHGAALVDMSGPGEEIGL
jgi:CRISPR-associated protein Cmr1